MFLLLQQIKNIERSKFILTSGNQSVERGAAILQTLSQNGSLGVTDIAKRVDLPKSIAYRLLASLKKVDLVRVDPKSRRYSLGYALLQMAADWLADIDVRNVAMPHLKKLRNDTHETVALNQREGDCRVTVERLDTSFEVRFVVDVGRLLPLHVGAAGKAILAFLLEDEISEIVARIQLSAHKERQLMKDLDEIRRLGFADTCGERVAGSRSVSSPIFNHEGVVVASVSVLSLQSRMQRREVNEYRRCVKAAALAISTEMGANQYSTVA